MLKNKDVVYILREGKNEELVHSIRSVEKNFPHNRIVFVGGKPDGLSPDLWIKANQTSDKWNNAQDLIKLACLDDRLTKEIILFNDDFFVIKPVEKLPIYVNKTLPDLAQLVTHGGRRESEYITKRIMPCIRKLKANSLPLRNYELHIPMSIDRKKMLEIYKRFNSPEAKRSFYGNYYHLRGIEIDPLKMDDGSVQKINGRLKKERTFISTTDYSWKGEAGEELKQMFPIPSKYELVKNQKIIYNEYIK